MFIPVSDQREEADPEDEPDDCSRHETLRKDQNFEEEDAAHVGCAHPRAQSGDNRLCGDRGQQRDREDAVGERRGAAAVQED